MKRSHRLVLLYRHLLRVGVSTTVKAAAHLDVERPKALADLKELAKVIPLEHTGTGKDTSWTLSPVEKSAKLGVLGQFALKAGVDIVRFLRGTGLEEPLERAAAVAPEMPAYLSRHLDRKFFHKPAPARRFGELGEAADDVIDGLLREHTLTLEYAPLNGDTRRFEGFCPLTLVTYRQAVYLVGRLPGKDSVLRLALDRVRSCEVGDEFEYPADWTPADELDPWFGITSSGKVERVALLFDAKVARYVKDRDWHKSATLTEFEDGAIGLEMVTGGPELVSFVLEWGDSVEVVAPGWLARRVADELRGALARYAHLAPRRPAPPLPDNPPYGCNAVAVDGALPESDRDRWRRERQAPLT